MPLPSLQLVVAGRSLLTLLILFGTSSTRPLNAQGRDYRVPLKTMQQLSEWGHNLRIYHDEPKTTSLAQVNVLLNTHPLSAFAGPKLNQPR